MYNNCVSSIALKEGGYTKKKKGFYQDICHKLRGPHTVDPFRESLLGNSEI